MTRDDRLATANRMLRIISEHGRGFFRFEGRVSRLDVDGRGRVWLTDKYTQKRIYTHYRYTWRGFSDGGTLRCLVVALRDYVMGRSPLPLEHLGPWPNWVCGGDLWGYGAGEMLRVRERCRGIEKPVDEPPGA